MRQVVLADNQDITRVGLKWFVEQSIPNCAISEIFTKKSLNEFLLLHNESLVILDYALFDYENVTDLQMLQERFEGVDWIVFSSELSTEFLQQLLYNTHSFSVLLKDSSKEEIITAIKEAHVGKRFISSAVSNLILDKTRTKQTAFERKMLTITEEEILKEIALGKTTKEIASLRFLSVHTIMTHRKNIFRKINVNNVHEATKYAMRAGLVDVAEYYI